METLQLDAWLERAAHEMGFHEPTPVQAQTVPAALSGRDVLASAPTGSGKTAAFALPILHALAKEPYGVYALVLSPARELAAQIADAFAALGAHLRISVATVVGGVDMMRQALELDQRPHVVVATPGRLADHLRSSAATGRAFKRLRYLVIDEADRVLELGFSADVEHILSELPKKRQTLLFSATMSQALRRLGRLALHEPFVADLAAHSSLSPTLTHKYVFVPLMTRDAYLVHLLRWHLGGEGEDGGASASSNASSSVIVFAGSCRECETLGYTLRGLGLDCTALHSQQPMRRRASAIARFKSGALRLIVATDVAARGLDIPAVELVINHNVPAAPADYVHRCGRTARAGRDGTAVTIVTQYDVEVLLAIEKDIGCELETLELPEAQVLKCLAEVSSARREAILALTENGFLEREKARRKRKLEEREGASEGVVGEAAVAVESELDAGPRELESDRLD